MAFYGKCGVNSNPGAMSGEGLESLLSGGSYFIFGQGGTIDTAARNWCTKNTGVKPTGGKSADFKTLAKTEMAKGLKRS
jgi:hypothetical protein